VDIQLSIELARQYIKNEQAIVLYVLRLSLLLLPSHPIFCDIHKLTSSHDSAITPADVVIVNQKWLNLVTEEHALDRTIGVITKTDRIEEMNHESVRIIHAILILLMLTWCIIDIQFA
jgi:hypothetical protein